MLRLEFPEGFLWGTATAGHQVEGNNTHSNWWTWEQQGLVHDGTRSGRACDYWNRYADDHARMKEFGHQIFRLGVEWSRIEPTPGRFDAAAVQHYRKILEDLRQRGLQVCLTLNHWVVPQWFAQAGSWLHPRALVQWDAFVRLVVRELGDLVDLWVTVNEPMVPVLAGYLAAHHPPCERNLLAASRVFTRLLHAHARAYRIIHEMLSRAPNGGPVMVGFAGAYQLFEPYHLAGWRRWLELPLARVLRQGSYFAWDRSVLTGRVQPPYGVGQNVPDLLGSVDFVGVNYYMRVSVDIRPATLSNIKSGGYVAPPGIEVSEMGWQIYPPGFHDVLLEVTRNFGVPIYVTENGCADSGDDMRRRYLVSHWAQMHRAIRHGADVRGYMHWTYCDNFEWREGFAKKFGLFAMDHTDPDLIRVPRGSAHLLREVIAANALTDDIVARYAPGALDRWPR